MENRILSKINNNMFHVPVDFLDGNSSFVFTYVDADTILVYPEENWLPRNVLEGVEMKHSTYEKVLDFICINSYVVKSSSGRFQIPNNFVGKLSFSDECYVVKTQYGFFISSIDKLQKTLVLK